MVGDTSSWVSCKTLNEHTKIHQSRRLHLPQHRFKHPIRLDDAVMEAEVGWAADIRRQRNIGNFTNWKDNDSYQKAFGRLLRDLTAGTGSILEIKNQI